MNTKCRLVDEKIGYYLHRERMKMILPQIKCNIDERSTAFVEYATTINRTLKVAYYTYYGWGTRQDDSRQPRSAEWYSRICLCLPIDLWEDMEENPKACARGDMIWINLRDYHHL